MRRTIRWAADPRGGAGVLWGAVVALLATGCVTMPGGGPPERVEVPQGARADDLQVHVYPVAPHKGESPEDLLAGFLDSSNADEPRFSTARKYLTEAAGKRWNPEAGVVVVADNSLQTTVRPNGTETGREFSISGSQLGSVDAKRSYRAMAGLPYQDKITFVKETEGPDKGEWRIDQLPEGLIVDQTNFTNGYLAAHRYFFAPTDPSASKAASRVLVPDPIYLRRRSDPLTAAAEALAAGPSAWLGPAVFSAMDGVRITTVSVGDNQVATVRVDPVDLSGRPELCQKMAEQLFHTLADQQGKLQRLDLTGAKGGCSVGESVAAQVAPGSLAGSSGTAQFSLQETGQLTRLQPDGPGSPVGGELGQPPVGRPRPGEVGVRRDAAAAAVIGADGKGLYVTGFAESDKLGEAVVSSRAPQPAEGLASPSWDGRGDLWLVDRDPAGAKVLMVRDRKAVPAQVDGLEGRSVQALRISSDGVRIALVLKDGHSRTVALGVVEHRGTPDAPQVRISGLRPLAPQLADIASVSWADSDQLLILGTEQGKLQQLRYLGTDGSQSSDTPLQGGDSMTAVSTTESRGSEQVPPALAVSAKRIYRLQGNQWREVTGQKPAVSFVYPG
ncbi:LpqB family beta-propeller domain-containing protein [Kitasatospora camelliae]|uniref:LpqB family beta-propeller domain-containing protein n=1 Tax=Kitasatospora camelliae TaxID=3156397 RepID=A0AAU8JV86_9ACTN